MKKLILMLTVLAIASIATAGPAWVYSVGGVDVTQVELGDIVTASLGAETISGMTLMGGPVTLSSVPIDNSTILPATFGTPPSIDGSTLNTFTYVFSAGATAGYSAYDQIIGITFTVNQAAVDAGVVNLTSGLNYALNGVQGTMPSSSVTVVPEPMTLGLLGLGGLFLRRRRA